MKSDKLSIKKLIDQSSLNDIECISVDPLGGNQTSNIGKTIQQVIDKNKQYLVVIIKR